jgi:hypothetical protein
MDVPNKIKRVQAIINRFLSKMSAIEAKKNEIISTEKKDEDTQALSQIQEKIKDL